MNQFILKYKHNDSIIGWFCTKEAAWDRMDFLTDSNSFGVFEVNVSIGIPENDGYVWVGIVHAENGVVLNTYADTKIVAPISKELIKLGVAVYKIVQFNIVGKEIKRPKKESDEMY